MNETAWAWLAGFIDGEGCLTAFGPRLRAPASLMLNLVNTDPRPLHFAAEIMGTAAAVRRRKRQGERRAITYVLEINPPGDLARILPRLLPHLLVKRAQGTLLLELATSRLAQRHRPRSAGRPLTARETEIISKLQTLNRRGIDKPDHQASGRALNAASPAAAPGATQ